MKRTPVYPIEAPERYFCRLLCIFVLWGWPCHLLAGMPSSAPPGPQQVPQRTGGQGGGHPFPPVLKTELPSDHILKYMDGLTKKSLKISDSQLTKLNLLGKWYILPKNLYGDMMLFSKIDRWFGLQTAIKELKGKYEAIPAGDRTVAHSGFLTGMLCVSTLWSLTLRIGSAHPCCRKVHWKAGPEDQGAWSTTWWHQWCLWEWCSWRLFWEATWLNNSCKKKHWVSWCFHMIRMRLHQRFFLWPLA